VLPLDPLASLRAVVRRPEIHASEQLTLKSAINGWTSGAAWASFDDHRKGTLKPGMLADLVVLSTDIFGGPKELDAAEVMMTVFDGFDPATRGRSVRISRYALKLAHELGVPQSEWESIELAAWLHDLGRSAVLYDVTGKARRLDVGERALMNTHPAVGAEMIQDVPGLERVAEIVLAHHERPDGRGYPRGLKGDEIPVGARIIMVCAAFDAMTEERPYRRSVSPEGALDELERESGTQFFPDVVRAFARAHRDGSLWEGFTGDEFQDYVRGSLAA